MFLQHAVIVITSYRRHRLGTYRCDREDRLRIHTRLSQGISICPHHYGNLPSEFRSARLNICTELQSYARDTPRPDLHGTAGSNHHSRRISQESSERTNLRYYDIHCKGDPFLARGAKSLVSYSAPYIKARLEVYLVVRSGSGGRHTNSAAAPVWSNHDPPAKPV